ncbi:MAG: hypothetical protein H6834_09005 [Planctomycetes bacterium]|nr:hypothetical protein [Planctomycetota bacterium]
MRCLVACWLFLLGFLLSPGHADELVLRNGTRITNCLLRDEGLRVRVWRTVADFPERDEVYERAEVRELRYDRDQAAFDDKERFAGMQDLSVTHIELTPKLPGLHGVYTYDATGAMRVVPRTELGHLPGHVDPVKAQAALKDLGEEAFTHPKDVVAGTKLTYDVGQPITLIAHVRNVGFGRAQPFDWVWEIDDHEVARGHCDETLEEQAITRFEYRTLWQEGQHHATFRLNPSVPEIASFNDRRREALTAFAYFYAVSKRRIDYAHRHRNTLGSFSFEDYYQWHLELMNDLLAASVHPDMPDGCRARVRLDRILYVDETTPEVLDAQLVGDDGLGRHQGGWIWQDDAADRRGEWHRPFGQFFGVVTEWSLPHELGHQLGLIDLYNLDYHGNEAPIVVDGRPLRVAHFYRHPRHMMHWHGPHVFSWTSASYLHRTWDLPRGCFGDYVFLTPDETWVEVHDVNGLPMADADVRVYQRAVRIDEERAPETQEGVTFRHVTEEADFPSRFQTDVPVIEGRTDAFGRLRLPNRPVKRVETINGYERRPNPFGNVNVVGQRGLMLIDVAKDGRHAPFWLSITDLNEACLRGHGARHVEVLETPWPSPQSPPEPGYPRLLTSDGSMFTLAWNAPVKEGVANEAHGYRVYRRYASEGLNFEPWEPLATVGADVHRFGLGALRDVPARPGGMTDHRRVAFAVSTINERGVESGLFTCEAPPLESAHALLYDAPSGATFLQVRQGAALWKVLRPGLYEDWTPTSIEANKAGDHFDANAMGWRVSSSWDRHAVQVYEPGAVVASFRIGHPWQAGEGSERFRQVVDSSIDERGWIAVADQGNRRIALYDAERRHRLDIPIEAKLEQVRLRGGHVFARTDRNVWHVFQLGADGKQALERARIEGVGPSNLTIDAAGDVVILRHGPSDLRRYSLDGALLQESRRLGGHTLRNARGLIAHEDGSLTTFHAFSELVRGRLADELASANDGLDLDGNFTHPLQYARPVLQPRVIVLNFDPLLDLDGRGDKRLHELAGWQDPRWLAEQFADSLYKASGGYVRHQVVEWQDLDVYPVKTDGFQYDDRTYWKTLKAQSWHQPDGMSYEWLVETYDLARRVRHGEIDEVWAFGAPGFGYYETRMVGPGAYWCNAPGLENTQTDRLFVVFGFNYERGVAEMIHDLGHATESILWHVYQPWCGNWQTDARRNDWERFSAIDMKHPGRGGVGNCHFPVNGVRDYDYANPTEVLSHAVDWLHYPDLQGRTEVVSAATWGGENPHLAYMHWLFTHLPRAPGRSPEGFLNNWWEYVVNFNAHAETRGR